MEQSTAEITEEYVRQHPDVKSCLKKGLINYSSLARRISDDLSIHKKSSKEAILVAARRMHDKLRKEIIYEKKISEVLAKSEMIIRNKICVFVLKKNVPYEILSDIQSGIREESGSFTLVEGTAGFVVITEDRCGHFLEKKLSKMIIKKEENLALISFVSPANIESVPGVVSYLTALFTEHGVNIIEMSSCWTDTFFVIRSSDVASAMEFLKF